MKTRENSVVGFTLVELLVVLAMLALLFSLLLPLIGRGLEMGRITQCMKNLASIMQAANLHAADHTGALTASISTGGYQGSEDHQKGWLGSEALPPGTSAPRGWYTTPGRLSPYYSGNTLKNRLFRCPSLDKGTLGSGSGSNGIHDYVMYSAFSGARLSLLPQTARFKHPATGQMVEAFLPIFAEEDPMYGINASFIDMDHTSINRNGTWHAGKSWNYVSKDGSAHRAIVGTWPGPQAYDWFATSRSGTSVSLGSVSFFEGWNRF